jgi:hypothetical protein
VAALDEILPAFDWHERHERALSVEPEVAVAALLATSAAPDSVVKTLFRLRGLSTASTIADSFRRMRFEELHRDPVEVVVGASGTPWRPRGGIRSFHAAGPGAVRMATDVRAVASGGGCVLSTETRIAALDDDARRAFARYWRLVGPFSALIRRRWLDAAARSLR